MMVIVRSMMLLICISIGMMTSARGEELAVATSIEQVEMTIRYHGQELQIFGEVQPGADVLVKVISPPETDRVAKKGKVLGLFWMNVKQAEIRNVPGFYMEISSTTLDRLSARVQKRVKIDGKYRFVREMAEVVPADEDAEFFLDGFIRAKEHQKLYDHREEEIDIIKGRLFRTTIRLPSRAPVGEYRLEVSTVKGNRVVGHGVATLRVEQTGLQQWITRMAQQHAALYGSMAVLLAVAAGIGVGFIFKGRLQ